MSEASPRPWRVSSKDAAIVLDARGDVVVVTALTGRTCAAEEATANAALIVAAVNAADAAALPGAIVEAIRAFPTGPACDRPLAHAAGCECGAL